MEWDRLRRGLVVTGGTSLAAAATFNALAARGVQPLANPLGGTEGSYRWRGHRVAFTTHGSGSPVLLLHGLYAGASSYEWRRNVEALAARHTVYAVDLLGFGRSDRPAVRYTASLYTQLVGDFAAQVVGAPCALVASALSAAHAIVLAARNPQRYPALVLVAPGGLLPAADERGGTRESARLLIDSPVIGTAVYNAMVTRAALRRALEPRYARPALVTPELLAHFYASAHQPGAKHAVAALAAGQLQVDVRAALRRLVQPLLLVWGRQAEQAPVEQAHNFRTLTRDAQLLVLDPAGDLPHDERAAEFNEATLRFLDPRDTVRVVA